MDILQAWDMGQRRDRREPDGSDANNTGHDVEIVMATQATLSRSGSTRTSSAGPRESLGRRRVTLLRVSYWVCGIFELMALVPMLSPTLFGGVMGIPDFHPGPDYGYAMGIAAVFTAGWVLLLFWASRRPSERRGVLLLTIAPVFVGNMLCGVYAASSGFIATTTMVPSWIAQAIIVVLFAFSYHEAGSVN